MKSGQTWRLTKQGLSTEMANGRQSNYSASHLQYAVTQAATRAGRQGARQTAARSANATEAEKA